VIINEAPKCTECKNQAKFEIRDVEGVRAYSCREHKPKRSGGIDAAIRKGTRLFDACDPCNAYVSENQVWARERGFIVRARDIDRAD